PELILGEEATHALGTDVARRPFAFDVERAEHSKADAVRTIAKVGPDRADGRRRALVAERRADVAHDRISFGHGNEGARRERDALEDVGDLAAAAYWHRGELTRREVRHREHQVGGTPALHAHGCEVRRLGARHAA